MARIRTTPGSPAFYRLLTNGTTREMTPDWQEIEDALITEGMRQRNDLEIEQTPIVTCELAVEESAEAEPAPLYISKKLKRTKKH